MAEINMQDATLEWLDQFLGRFSLGTSTMPRTDRAAQRWFLSDALGVYVDDLTRSNHNVTFATNDLTPEGVRALLDATLVDGDRRYVFSGLTTTMHCEPYSEPSPHIEVSFTVAK
jgi:hypothetical protein